jgi:uncharacterized protein
MTATRFYMVRALDNPGMRDVRDHFRPHHRRYLKTALDRDVFVRLGGSTLDPQCGAMNGTLLVIEAEHIDDVMRFVENDPYARAGLFQHVEVHPWDWSLGNPERRL